MHRSYGLQHLRHKRLTFAFTGESGYTLAFASRSSHSGSHAEIGALPPVNTAQLCATNRIALNATSAILDSAALLYTYIPRFFVNPHYQQREKIRQRCHRNSVPNRFSSRFSTSLANGPRSLSRVKVRTHSALLKGSYTAAHAAKQGAFRMGRYYYPRTVSHVSEALRGQGVNWQTLPLLGLGRGCSQRTQRAYGTAMRLCVSLFRGAAAPPGCVVFFHLCRN